MSNTSPEKSATGKLSKKELEAFEASLGDPPTLKFNRGGKIKEVPIERLRYPHAVTYARGFRGPNNPQTHSSDNYQSPNSDNAGGLLQNGSHRPGSDSQHHEDK